jgi:hypothetical protein
MSDPKQQNSYPLRMPEELRKQLEDAAKASQRSMNAEIVTRLQKSFEPNIASLNWLDLMQLLQAEAKKHGTTISITVG